MTWHETPEEWERFGIEDRQAGNTLPAITVEDLIREGTENPEDCMAAYMRGFAQVTDTS